MALKDKLMTLEDFKAVRDVDVASNSAQFTEIKADLDAQTGIIRMTKNAYIETNTTPISLEPHYSSVGRMCAVIDCVAGDKFVINAYSDSVPARIWCFIDSNNNVIAVADSLVTATDLELVAPANATKLIINDMHGGLCYKVGNNLASKLGNSSGLSDDIKDAILNCFKHVAWADTNGTTYYNTLSEAFDIDEIVKNQSIVFAPNHNFTNKSTISPSIYVEYNNTSRQGFAANNPTMAKFKQIAGGTSSGTCTEDSIYSAIKVPKGKSNIIVTCPYCRCNINWYKLSSSGYYLYGSQSGWQTANTKFTFPVGTYEYFTIIFDTANTDSSKYSLDFA